MNPLILRVCGRLVLPVALAFSLFLLWRGHNEPGGGFVGGLMAAAGLAIYALPRGRAALRLHRQGYQDAAAIRSELWWCAALAAVVAGDYWALVGP